MRERDQGPAKAPAAGRSHWLPTVVLPELVWMLVLVFGYSLARLAVGNPTDAYANAHLVWHLERALHLPLEVSLQHWALESPDLTRLANAYYGWVHFPGTALFLLWVYARHHDQWRWVRNTMTSMTACALLLQAAVPLAPPRLVHGWGFVDTGIAFGQSVYGPTTQGGLANQFAAMPSVHVGWALVVGVGIVLVADGPWRWLGLAHPVITLVVVTVTANHYWVDSVVAGVIVGVAVLVHRPRGRVEDAADPPRPPAAEPVAWEAG